MAQSLPLNHVGYLPIIGYGHAPIILNTSHTPNLNNSTMLGFKLNGSLTLNIYTLGQDTWASCIHGSLAYQLTRTIHLGKQAIKK